MLDLQLDTNGDLLVPESGDRDLGMVQGADQTAQRLRTRLRLFQGEWFLDLDAGIPWFTGILGKNLDLGRAEAILRREILATPEVTGIAAFERQYDPRTRQLTVSFTATTAQGAASFQGTVP